MFYGSIEKCETRMKDPVFFPSLDGEPDLSQRNVILEWLKQAQFLLKHNRSVSIARLYHGTTSEAARNICVTGFADLSKLDAGWYGRAIYLADSPLYSLEYCESTPNPCIIITYAIIFNPFPVTSIDTSFDNPSQFRFYGKGHHKNFWCHIVQVSRYGVLDYRPPKPGNTHEATEFAMFDENHLLPVVLIHLTKKKTIPSNPSINWSIDDVVRWIKNLSLSQDYSQLIMDNAVDGSVLMTMTTDDDWKYLGITKFGDIRKCKMAIK